MPITPCRCPRLGFPCSCVVLVISSLCFRPRLLNLLFPQFRHLSSVVAVSGGGPGERLFTMKDALKKWLTAVRLRLRDMFVGKGYGSLRVPSHKLAPRFIGPYPIVKVISPVQLRLPNSFHRVHPGFFMFLVLNLFCILPILLLFLLLFPLLR